MIAIKKIKLKLKERGFDAIIIPKWDKYRSEYVSPHDDFLKWISNFSGSHGVAVIEEKKNNLFVDGRYTLQAEKETKRFKIFSLSHLEPWVTKNLAFKKVVYNPWLFSKEEIEHFGKTSLLVPDAEFLEDLWTKRPAKPILSVGYYAYSGMASFDKRNKVYEIIEENKADYFLLTKPESISWLLNIRNHYKEFSPVVEAFALINKEGAIDLFFDHDEISYQDLFGAIKIFHIKNLPSTLALISDSPILVDKKAPVILTELLTNPIVCDDPIIPMKAIKNDIELQYAEICHRRDGAALSEFLYWLQFDADNVDELGAASQLLEFRKRHMDFIQESFPTISASGPNGAIIHYRPTIESNRPLGVGEIYLIDSGGQYFGCTTDVTRTILFHEVEADENIKEIYTNVLKGHIALSSILFPQGTTGAHLDVLARQFLWQAKLDYAHGTGHGVGNYLNVHEGPQAINGRNFNVPLQAGMILSIEPGFYKKDCFGIRLENLVYVKNIDEKFLGFQALTLAPFEPNLINFSMLTQHEVQWLAEYHANMLDKLQYLVSTNCRRWLFEVTRVFENLI